MTTRETIDRMARDISTQDNAATHEPIFMVQRHVRTYGFDPAYSDDTAVWLENDDHCEVTDFSEYQCPECDKALSRDEFEDEYCAACSRSLEQLHVTHTAYQDRWENVQPFFTRSGAEEYLRVNGHNLVRGGKEPPRIYVESAFRNAEWQAVRAHLPTCAAVVDACLLALDTADMSSTVRDQIKSALRDAGVCYDRR